MDEARNEYSFGNLAGNRVKAEDAYERGTAFRQQVIDMGRLMAELTVPTVFPPEGYRPGDDIPGNNQSIGAACFNTLVSKLVLMAFPPGQPIARLKPEEPEFQEEVDNDPDFWAKLVLALSRLELAHREILQTTPLETVYAEFMKVLLAAGNAMCKQWVYGEPTFHKPDTYIVRRDKNGNPLVVIHKQSVSVIGMEEEHRAFVMANVEEERFRNVPDYEQEVTVYCCQKMVRRGKKRMWLCWEEFCGEGQASHTLPGTEFEADYDAPPMHAGWLVPCYEQDWGTGYLEMYRGDLYTLEAHASSVNDGASLAALSLMFVKPGSQTSIKQIRQAKNLSVLAGNAEDIGVFRSEKTADLNFVVANMEAVGRRLAAAFLLQSSVQRSGERVTAEEIARLGNELDKALGHLYTMIAQQNQKPILKRAIKLNEDEYEHLPALPEEKVKVNVITGKDAIGNNAEADGLTGWAGTMKELFPTQAEKRISIGNFGTRLAALRGVKPDGLLIGDEEAAANNQKEQQAAMLQEAVAKGTGPAVKGIADNINQGGGGAQQLATPPAAQGAPA